MKKKGLLSSILTIALCISLIAGSTFALFTSNSTVDIAVTSGGVELNASVDMSGLKTYSLNQPQAMGKFAAGGSATILNGALIFNKIVPGDRAEFPISLINRSDIDVQYRVVVSVEGELANGLVVTALLNGKSYNLTDPTANNYAGKTQWFFWDAEAGASRNQIDMVIELPKNAGNEFQKKSAVISVTVEAVQANAEIWDGESVNTDWYADYGTAYYIRTGADLAGLAQLVASGKSFYGKTVTLMNDINLNELPWTPMNQGTTGGFNGTFDGNGHTISGLYIDQPDQEYVSLFGRLDHRYGGVTIKNLEIDGAFVRGSKYVAAIASHGNATVITDCTVKNSTIIATEKRAGALIGYVWDEAKNEDPSIDNNVVENVTVYIAQDVDQPYDAAIGTANPNPAAHVADEVTASTNTIVNSEIIVADRVIMGITDFFAFADEVNGGELYTKKKVVLHSDINLRNILWTPIGVNGTYFNGTFDGQGHTVSNLYVKNDVKDAAGLFGHARGTIKNLNVENANVISTYKAAVIVGDIYGYIDNCSVKNAVVEAKPILKAGVYDEGNNAGVIVGYLAEGSTKTGTVYTVTNCSVENAVVAAYRDLGAIAGTAQKETKIADCTATNVSLAYLTVFPYADDEVNKNAGEIAGRALGTALIENCTATDVKKDIYLIRPVSELIAGNAYTTISKAGTYEITENMFFYDKELIKGGLTGDITVNGNGNILTYNDVAGKFDVDYFEYMDDYGYRLESTGTITLRDLTFLTNLHGIYVGKYGTTWKPGENPYKVVMDNVRILNLETHTEAIPSTSVANYADLTLNNCQMIGSVDAQNEGEMIYDLVCYNGSQAFINGGEYGNILTWFQCNVVVNDATVKSITARAGFNTSTKVEWAVTITGNSYVETVVVDSTTSPGLKRNVKIGAGATVDTLVIDSLTKIDPARIVIEDGATVNHLIVEGVETTYNAWVAAYNAALNP
ncbi:MAG: hypothetical protein E7620_07385 [Ruminococcaceae bacterium]|nr:hypothetical protein [Oscillospiraceae bacterium]